MHISIIASEPSPLPLPFTNEKFPTRGCEAACNDFKSMFGEHPVIGGVMSIAKNHSML